MRQCGEADNTERRHLLPSKRFLVGANIAAAIINLGSAYMNYRLGGFHFIGVVIAVLMAAMSFSVAAWVYRRYP